MTSCHGGFDGLSLSRLVRSCNAFVLLEFTQPQRCRPYLAGQFVWLLEDEPDAAVLHEEINAPAALNIVNRPLHGSALSLRRWLFFNGGHQRLMKSVAGSISALLVAEAGPRR